MIKLRNVSKRFVLKTSGSSLPGGRVARSLLNIHSRSDLWALSDVSLELEQGGSLALLGVNGSGKSTLFRIISGVSPATSGEVSVTGRVGGIVELTAGFHDDLTGMENIFLHATLAGLSRREILQRLEQIVAFAEIGRFINAPVRIYSWGMLLRLAFAIAVHTDPDILLIDEALSVGDGYFQWKCMQRIEEMKRAGKTVLFVTHIPGVAETVCEKAMWLHAGEVRALGPAGEVAAAYNDFLFKHLLEQKPHQKTHLISALVPHLRVGTGEVLMEDVKFLNSRGEARRSFVTGEMLCVDIGITAHHAVMAACVTVDFQLPHQPVAHLHSERRGSIIDIPAGTSRIKITFPSMDLRPGTYYVSLSIQRASETDRFFDSHIKLYSLTFSEPAELRYSSRLVRIPAEISAAPLP